MGVGFGIFLGLCGSISINTGNNLQSLGMHEIDDGANMDAKPNLCKNRTWVIGTVVFVTGALLNFASFGFAPQSTLASLESIQFVSNLFFGWWLLDEVITQKMMIGTALTVGGTVLAVVFSSKEAAEVETVEDLVQLWNNDFWIGYIIILVVLAFILHLCYRNLEKKQSKDFENIMALCYAVFSALFGTLSVVFAKLLAKLVEFQASGENIFANWYTYFIVLSWLVLMAFWLYRLNAALGLYNPLFIIPLLQANFIFFAIVSGGIYFQEFNYMIKLNWIGFIFGIACMFAGIFMLVPPKEESQKEEVLEYRRQNTMKKGAGVDVAKMFMTGPARINDEKHFKRRIKYQKQLATSVQSQKNLTKTENELTKVVYKNVYTGEKMMKSEEELKNILVGKRLGKGSIVQIQNQMIACKNMNKEFMKGEKKAAELKEKVEKERRETVDMKGEEKVADLQTKVEEERREIEGNDEIIVMDHTDGHSKKALN